MSPWSGLVWLQQNAGWLGITGLVGALFFGYFAYQAAERQRKKLKWLDQVWHWVEENALLLFLIPTVIFAGVAFLLLIAWLVLPTLPTAQATAVPTAAPTTTPTLTAKPIPAPTIQPAPTVVVQDTKGLVLATVAPTEAPPAPAATSTPPPLPTVTFFAQPPVVDPGTPINLYWQIQPTDRVKAVRVAETPVAPDATWQVKPVATTNAYVLQVELTETTLAYTVTVQVNTPAPTPTPPHAYVSLSESDQVQLYLNATEEGGPVAILKQGALVANLQITGQTPDGEWYSICCFAWEKETNKSLWLKGKDQDGKDSQVIQNKAALTNTQQLVIGPTATPVPPPFARTIGPEFHKTGGQMLTILVKIYAGDGVSAQAQPGYLLAVQLQPKGQNKWQDRPSSNSAQNGNGDNTSQAEFVNTNGGAYNYKYEYRPDSGVLEEGTWQIWLTNAEHHQMSSVETFTTDANNDNREIYIGWKQER